MCLQAPRDTNMGPQRSSLCKAASAAAGSSLKHIGSNAFDSLCDAAIAAVHAPQPELASMSHPFSAATKSKLSCFALFLEPCRVCPWS